MSTSQPLGSTTAGDAESPDSHLASSSVVKKRAAEGDSFLGDPTEWITLSPGRLVLVIIVKMVKQSPELAELLGNLALKLQNQSGTEATLRAIVDGAVNLVPGARWAGISMIRGRKVSAEVPTDPLVAELDKLQSLLNEGPCVTALREHHSVLIEDMVTDTRWPRFARAAVDRGVSGLLSFQLFVHDRNFGALNLYGDDSRAFNEESLLIGGVLAQHASIAICGAAAEAQFDAALASRDVIGQAKGLLMQRESLTGLQAFELLLKTSKNSNIKLVEIARWVVDQHESGLDRS